MRRKRGARGPPAASISSRPAALIAPTSVITPPATATSARNGSPPLPSITVPLRRTRSGLCAMQGLRLGCAHRRATLAKVKHHRPSGKGETLPRRPGSVSAVDANPPFLRAYLVVEVAEEAEA